MGNVNSIDWVPTNLQLADCLTKIGPESKSRSLMKLFSDNRISKIWSETIFFSVETKEPQFFFKFEKAIVYSCERVGNRIMFCDLIESVDTFEKETKI